MHRRSRQPISQADLASHEMLARALDAACPGMPLISEEDVESLHATSRLRSS
jgi:3'-phosphoadenosine 5'-phosphosulfate (PAPS) 3'-phosphatase